MSDRTAVWVGMLTLAAFILPVRAMATQDPGELQRRLARLDALEREAAETLARADSLRRERLDTVRSGGLVILVRPGDAGLVRHAAPSAWAALDSLYGDEARALAAEPFLFYIMTRPVRYLPPQADRLQRVMAGEDATSDDVSRQLIVAGGAAMRARGDTAFTNWLGPILLPAIHAGAQFGRVYVELVTAPSVAVRHCYDGDVAGCRAALGLLDGHDPVAVWFDARERRALVQRRTVVELRTVRAAADACLTGKSDAGCLEVLHAVEFLEPPLSIEARHSLARLALAAGGRAAYGRLQRSVGRPLSERLAIAAALPSDSLMARWRSTILAARPKAVTLAARGAWIALGWAVVFGLLALRSTRWR